MQESMYAGLNNQSCYPENEQRLEWHWAAVEGKTNRFAFNSFSLIKWNIKEVIVNSVPRENQVHSKTLSGIITRTLSGSPGIQGNIICPDSSTNTLLIAPVVSEIAPGFSSPLGSSFHRKLLSVCTAHALQRPEAIFLLLPFSCQIYVHFLQILFLGKKKKHKLVKVVHSGEKTPGYGKGASRGSWPWF